MYKREPVLPVELKYELSSEPVDLSEPLDQHMSEAVLSTANAMRDKIHEPAGRNINKAQVKQNSNFNRQHLPSSTVNIG